MSCGCPNELVAMPTITASIDAKLATVAIVMVTPYTSSDMSSRLMGMGMPDAFNFSENLGTIPVA